MNTAAGTHDGMFTRRENTRPNEFMEPPTARILSERMEQLKFDRKRTEPR